MRHKQQHIDEEHKQADDQVEEAEDEDDKEVSRRVRGRVEVAGYGEDEHDQGEEGCYGMQDEEVRQRGSR